MTTKIVYVLTSSSEDTYLERTLISAFSARLHNPDATLLVVTDQVTLDNLKGKRAEIKKYVTDFIVVDIPTEYNNMQKSRYIKTNLRKFVKGNFLYIDCDTVIVDSLAEIDDCKYELAAVYNANRPLPIGDSGSTSDRYINSHTKTLGWPSVKGYPNYNGGVIFSKDTEKSHQFYTRWFELWTECTHQGVNIDMPALCRANIELDCCIEELPGIWNCQIQRQGLALLPQAKIIHSFTTGNLTLYELCTDRVLEKIKSQGSLDEEIVELIKHAKTAFPRNTTIIKSEEAKLLNLPIIQLYYKNHTLFRILNKIAYLVLKYFKP